jgi:hypothetical protein
MSVTRYEKSSRCIAQAELAAPCSTDPRRSAKDVRQPVDPDHEDILLDPLDAPRTDETHDARVPRCAAAQSRFAGVREPAVLLAARVVGPLPDEGMASRRDVPTAPGRSRGTPNGLVAPRDSAPSAQYLACIGPSQTTTTSMPNRYPPPDSPRSQRPPDAGDARRVGSHEPSRLRRITNSGPVTPTAGFTGHGQAAHR